VSRNFSFIAAAVAIAAVGAALRLLAVPQALPDLDSVNFASSLSRFDLATQAPHFPGYPLYVLAARGFAALGAGEILALALPGIVLAALASIAMAVVGSRAGGAAGLGAGILVALAPVGILAGGSPSSDGAGVAALALALALHVAAPSRGLVCGLAAAGVIGLRPSLAPAVAMLWFVVPAAGRRAWFGGAAVGCAAWFLPMVAITGIEGFGAIAAGFLAGHGGSWGGTIWSRPDLGGRLHAFVFDLFAANLALPWSGLWGAGRLLVAAAFVAVVAGLIGRVAADRTGSSAVAGGSASDAATHPRSDRANVATRLVAVALLSAIPYGLWAFVGQNLDKARHLLPMVPAIALAFAACLGSLRASLAAPALACAAAGLLAVAAPASLRQGREISPGAAMAMSLRGRVSPAGAMIFTGQEGKLVERYAPEFRAGRVPDPARLGLEASRLFAAGVDVFVTSAAPGASLLAADLQLVDRFGACSQPLARDCELLLYRFRPDKGSI